MSPVGQAFVRIPPVANRRLIVVIAVLAAVGAVGSAYRAVELYRDPFPAWTSANRWYEQVLGAVMDGVIAGACVHYLRRRARHARSVAAGVAAAWSTRWRDKAELRVVLYGFVALGALMVPLEFLKAWQAVNDPQAPFHHPYWSELSPEVVMGPLVAAGIVLYDRRRVRRDRREDGACEGCGYDLRATPERCPECGRAVTPGATVRAPKSRRACGTPRGGDVS